jgi:PPOX class probable F420-dependent enzyme
LIDPSTPFGQRLTRRLRDEIVVWLTTVGSDLTPQPNPVWFLWDDQSVLTYNRTDSARVAHIRGRPRVSLNFDGDGRGGDIIVITGDARHAPDEPPSHEVEAYVEKYGERMIRVSGSLQKFSQEYPVPIRIFPSRIRGH